VPDADAAAVALLRARGYVRLVSEWLLEYVMAAGEPSVPPAPSGVAVRRFRPGDARVAHRLAEDAFDEWQPRRKPYEEWARQTVERAAFEPEASPVAFVGDEMVGVVLSLDVPDAGEGYVQVVAVRHDHRRRGLARLLLHEAFRDFHRLGRRACTLGTHSDTGALTLYEHLGMTVRRSSTVYGRPLT
jgi:mycothiol synthase